jgi:hypothetical protein
MAAVLEVPDDVRKQIDRLIYNFIWNGGVQKIKHVILTLNYNKGGLRMLDLNTMIQANRIMWIKRLLNPEVQSFWKTCLE